MVTIGVHIALALATLLIIAGLLVLHIVSAAESRRAIKVPIRVSIVARSDRAIFRPSAGLPLSTSPRAPPGAGDASDELRSSDSPLDQ